MIIVVAGIVTFVVEDVEWAIRVHA